MDIETLRAFLTVAQLQSFSKAADSLHLTQPAVSKRVASLEQAAGAQLFDRVGRQILLTEAGRVLLPRAEAILAQLAEARRALRELDGEVAGPLALAISHHLGLHKLPPLLREFKQRYSQVDLAIEFLDSEVAHHQVLAGHCEVAAVTLAPAPVAGLAATPLWPDPLVFACAHDSPAASARSLAELSQFPAILPDARTYTGRLVAECFTRAGLPLPRAMTTNYLETIKTMVQVGLGWSVLPESLCAGELRVLPIAGISLRRTLGLVVSERRQLSNAARAFCQLLQTAATPVAEDNSL